MINPSKTVINRGKMSMKMGPGRFFFFFQVYDEMHRYIQMQKKKRNKKK